MLQCYWATPTEQQNSKSAVDALARMDRKYQAVVHDNRRFNEEQGLLVEEITELHLDLHHVEEEKQALGDRVTFLEEQLLKANMWINHYEGRLAHASDELYDRVQEIVELEDQNQRLRKRHKNLNNGVLNLAVKLQETRLPVRSSRGAGRFEGFVVSPEVGAVVEELAEKTWLDSE